MLVKISLERAERVLLIVQLMRRRQSVLRRTSKLELVDPAIVDDRSGKKSGFANDGASGDDFRDEVSEGFVGTSVDADITGADRGTPFFTVFERFAGDEEQVERSPEEAARKISAANRK